MASLVAGARAGAPVLVRRAVARARASHAPLTKAFGLPAAAQRVLAFYWTFSVATILGNKLIMSRLGFNFPVLLTCVHFAVNLLIAGLVCGFRAFGVEAPRVGWHAFATGLVPIALFHGGDIVLSNASYSFLEVSFFAMVKTSVVPLTFLLSLAVSRRWPERRLAFDVAFVFLGILLAVYGEAAFSAVGFVLLLVASCCSAMRVVWADRVLRGVHGVAGLHPVALLVYTLPVSLPILLVAFAVREAPLLVHYSGTARPWEIALVFVASGLVAFPLNVGALLVLQRTSATTMAVTNVIKDVLVISLSWLLFQNTLTVVNVLGGALAVLAVLAYALDKHDLAAHESTAAAAEAAAQMRVVARAADAAEARVEERVRAREGGTPDSLECGGTPSPRRSTCGDGDGNKDLLPGADALPQASAGATSADAAPSTLFSRLQAWQAVSGFGRGGAPPALPPPSARNPFAGDAGDGRVEAAPPSQEGHTGSPPLAAAHAHTRPVRGAGERWSDEWSADASPLQRDADGDDTPPPARGPGGRPLGEGPPGFPPSASPWTRYDGDGDGATT